MHTHIFFLDVIFGTVQSFVVFITFGGGISLSWLFIVSSSPAFLKLFSSGDHFH